MKEARTPMLESELNELVHYVADFLEQFRGPIDRYELNTVLTELAESYGISLQED